MSTEQPVGIVICGGRSTRMGTDKGSIVYHVRPQRDHVAAMLRPFCATVYLGINEVQQYIDAGTAYPLLIDLPEYRDKGPMAALLTAGRQLPGRDLLVIGCDYPLLEEREWETFVRTTPKGTLARAFYNEKIGMYEPLLAYYAAPAVKQLLEQAEQYRYSLQQFLHSCNAAQYFPEHEDSMMSADDPLAAAFAREKIAGRKAAGR